MKSKWAIKKLYEIVDFNPKESIKRGTVAKKISMDQLLPFCKDVKGYVEEKFSGGMKFRNGDTIMARITPCLENGKIAQISILDDGEIGFGSTEYIVFRAKEGVADPNYIYYLVCSSLIREPAIKSMVGSSGRQRVQLDVIQNLDIYVPSIVEQQKIGGFLGLLDEKIAINNKINDNLEQQAQAIFKSWFVDFEPFGNSMPKTWHMERLGAIATIRTNSFSPIKNPDVMLEHYSIPAFDERKYPLFESAKDVKSNKYILTPNSVMVSKLNPNTKRVWRPMCLSKLAVSSTEFIIYEANNIAYRDFIYSVIDSSAFSDWMCSHTTGSTNSRQRTTPNATLEFEIPLADNETISRFCDIVTPMYDTISQNIIETQKLAKLRDFILPRLMSGEIDVFNLNI